MKYSLFILLFLLSLGSTIAQGPDDDYLNAYAFYLKDEPDSALLYFDRYLLKHSDDLETTLLRGCLLFDRMQFNKAAEDFLNIERRRKGMAAFWLAKTEVRLKHPQQAIKYLRDHLASRYREPESVILLDEDMTRLENYPEWKNLWNEKEWYSQLDRQLQEATILVQKESYPDALNMLEELDHRGIKRSDVKLLKAGIYEKSGNLKAALEECESAVKADVRNLAALRKRADLYVETGKFEKAIEDCNKLLYLEPADFKTYLLRASALEKNSQPDAALADYQLYLHYFPDADSVYYAQGLNFLSQKKYISALESFNQALNRNKASADYFTGRGKTYAATGSLRFAQKDFSMALDLEPLRGEIWLEKGKVEARMGNRDTACHDYRKALQYGMYEARSWLESNCLQK